MKIKRKCCSECGRLLPAELRTRCHECGRRFRAERKHRRYCSNACRLRAWRRRKREPDV